MQFNYWKLNNLIKGQLLKEQFFITYESLRPGNLLRSTLKDIASSPYLIDNILGAAMGLVSGFISRKIIYRCIRQ